jgi:hypothetical protein
MLDTILWVTPDTSYLDEAEEFLSQQHDNSIKQMYRVKRAQAQVRKIEKTVDKYDLAIPFQTSVTDILTDDDFYYWMDLLV